MRYYIDGLEVRSENAAKPPHRASAWLLDWIRRYPADEAAIDYGCGKLRYSLPLYQKFRKVRLVDSTAQLTRFQVIEGRETTIIAEAQRLCPKAEVFPVEDPAWKDFQADLALCVNVLSAIPFEHVRREVIGNLARVLIPGGQLLMATQYTNSHYSAWERDVSTRHFSDGVLIPNRNGASFYARINLPQLTAYAQDAGLHVVDAFRTGQTAVVVASAP